MFGGCLALYRHGMIQERTSRGWERHALDRVGSGVVCVDRVGGNVHRDSSWQDGHAHASTVAYASPREGRPSPDVWDPLNTSKLSTVLNTSNTSSTSSTASSSFSIPLRRRTRTQEESPCFWCSGTATMPCGECGGTGRAPTKKNHHARNHVNISRVVGTKWTALERTFGWRHFEVKEVLVLKPDPKKKNSKQTYVLLEATCDATARLWVDIDILKSRQIWSAGWLQKEMLQKLLAEDQHEASDAGPRCKACAGTKTVPCRYCCCLDPIQLF